MRIYKVINNNMVSVRNDDEQEIMLKGLSIGFKKKPGDVVEEAKIEKRFVLADEAMIRHFGALLVEVDKQVIDACIDAITVIKANAKVELSDALYVTIIDHVHNLIDRLKSNITFDNSILWDLRRIYPDEYLLAKETIRMLNEKLPYNIPEDEANFITLHIVNAEKANDMHKIYKLTRLINDICDIVGSDFSLDENDDDYFYHRFVMHLRFMLENIERKVTLNVNENNKVLQALVDNYPNVWLTVKKIISYIDVCVGYSLSEGEQLYLMIHLVQIYSTYIH